MKQYIRKLIQFLMFYPVYYFIWFSIFGKDLLNSEYIGLIIIIYYGISFFDIILRPIGDPNELKDKYTIIVMLFFFLGPLILILAFYENKFIISQYLSLYDNELIGYFGILLMLIGGIILLTSRYQLNRYSYGGGSLSEEIEQKLITDGMYKYIRHPIYAGGIVMTIGLELAFRSLIILSLHTILYFVIFKDRMNREEEVLLSKFGEHYRKYMNETKRMIPYFY
ncbi:MAG: methyltransferase family protein [Candidatus Hodarchaeota archaeon]